MSRRERDRCLKRLAKLRRQLSSPTMDQVLPSHVVTWMGHRRKLIAEAQQIEARLGNPIAAPASWSEEEKWADRRAEACEMGAGW